MIQISGDNQAYPSTLLLLHQLDNRQAAILDTPIGQREALHLAFGPWEDESLQSPPKVPKAPQAKKNIINRRVCLYPLESPQGPCFDDCKPIGEVFSPEWPLAFPPNKVQYRHNRNIPRGIQRPF